MRLGRVSPHDNSPLDIGKLHQRLNEPMVKSEIKKRIINLENSMRLWRCCEFRQKYVRCMCLGHIFFPAPLVTKFIFQKITGKRRVITTGGGSASVLKSHAAQMKHEIEPDD